MKKKLMAILLVGAMMFSLVGCTPNMASYSNELQKVAKWDGYTFESKADIELEVKDSEQKNIKFNMPMEMKGKAKGQDLAEMNMKMSLKELKKVAVESGEEIPVTIPDEVNMKIFATAEKAYIEKKFFTEMLGEEAPEEIKNVKEDYLAINMQSNIPAMEEKDKAKMETLTKYLQSKEFEVEILSIIEKAFKGFKPSVDIEVKGNTYSYNATVNDIVKDTNLALESIVNNYSELETPILELLRKFEIPMTKENLQEAVKAYDKEAILEQSKSVEEMLKGSKISTKTTFEKDSYNQEVKLQLNVLEMVNMNMNVESIAKKAENIEIKLPTSVKEITMMEYFTMLGGMATGEMDPYINVRVNAKNIEFDSQMPEIVEGRTLVPVRAFLEEIGAEVKWDEKAKKVTAKKDDMNIELNIGSKIAKVNGKEVSLDVAAEIKNDRTMIPLRFISENLGYKVRFDNSNSPFYQIDIYSGTEEELDKKIVEEEKALNEEIEKALKEMDEELTKEEKAA